jgi:release factor glutamine methyltransferase
MFVQTNTIKAIKKYIKEKLQVRFSESEIRLISNELMKSRMNLSTSDLLIANENLLSESDLLFFRSCVKRLLNDEPFQHIIGSTLFYGLELKTDERALIPRPETEELVEWIVSDFSGVNNLRIIDLCTGTGCIALSLKSVFDDASIDAIDYSLSALSLAKENSNLTHLPINLRQLDVLSEAAFSPKIFLPNSYDIWVSNPPYIPEMDKEKMEKNVLEFEPEMALFVSNENPLVFYKKIALDGLNFLKSNGVIYFEIHEDFGNGTSDFLKEIGYKDVVIRKDLQGKDRMIKAVKS